jgi:hypothetical protein
MTMGCICQAKINKIRHINGHLLLINIQYLDILVGRPFTLFIVFLQKWN